MSDSRDISSLDLIDTNVASLKQYYPDSLQLDLIEDIDQIPGSYSYSDGYTTGFLQLDAAYRYEGSGWDHVMGNSKKVRGEWKMKDATLFIQSGKMFKAFDVVRYQDTQLLVPVNERQHVVSLLSDFEEIADHIKKQMPLADAEERIRNGQYSMLSRYKLFTKE